MYVLAATQLQLTECVCVSGGVRESSGVRLGFVLTPDWITKMQGGFTVRLAQPWATLATESNSEPNLKIASCHAYWASADPNLTHV